MRRSSWQETGTSPIVSVPASSEIALDAGSFFRATVNDELELLDGSALARASFAN